MPSDFHDDNAEGTLDRQRNSLATFFADYFWIIVKNFIGWTLIIAAWPLGILIPGPGGIPLFLIGFGLVTFPGKRRLTARVLRGKPMRLEGRLFTWLTLGVSSLAAAGGIWTVAHEYFPWQLSGLGRLGVLLLTGAITWIIAWPIARGIWRAGNVLIRNIPRIRRRVRPWLRHHGIDLLPPRRYRRKKLSPDDLSPAFSGPDEQIIHIHERHGNNLRYGWAVAKPWIKRFLSIAVTVAIFVWMLRPIIRQFRDNPQVRDRILQTSVGRFVLAAAMFAVFLLVFRALAWRKILKNLAHRVPIPAAVRIWSYSELARYLPGAIWQVVGRVYLIKPYGVRGSVCSASQILELTLFLLANILVAVGGLLLIGVRRLSPEARPWLLASVCLAPLLLLLLHPRIFYGSTNRILGRFGKPSLDQRLSGTKLLGVLGWYILGLMWQTLAVWVLLSQPNTLGLGIEHFGKLAGAYCLAWCAGFLAIWAPGGLGVREMVLMASLGFALPVDVAANFTDPHTGAIDPAAYLAFLGFLSLLLRLWTVAGEVLLAATVTWVDRTNAARRVGVMAEGAA